MVDKAIPWMSTLYTFWCFLDMPTASMTSYVTQIANDTVYRLSLVVIILAPSFLACAYAPTIASVASGVRLGPTPYSSTTRT